ncbi:NACHT domain-containing NTPase [Streptomyces sp. UNOC14_S4]|uniref:NACHT domain-containing protein n=1 Tax=Streptomyces sp. UNOC14_S4 TaxID=2872340 RepID=UPI001E387C3E|nr:NACHT domain-containing protein [Streptomyces sp. UNOC14_S4]MCC3768912.1 NACHT domain-containing protein [Streptomyces sp. UNOC14_S4]
MRGFLRRIGVRDSGPAMAIGSHATAVSGVFIGGAVSQEGDVRGVLADLVRQQWDDERTSRELEDPVAIPVRWRTTRDLRLMDTSKNLAPSSLRLTFTCDDISPLVREFRLMPRRRLVIVGEAGSGKTSLAVLLVRALLADGWGKRRGKQGSDEPVPVLLSVADWDPEKVKPHDWIVGRLSRDYPSLGIARLTRLVAKRQVLPVLDGLDEMPDGPRAAAITALSRYLVPEAPLILTCRTTAYLEAVGESARKTFASALVIEPCELAPRAVADYLRRCRPDPGPSWERVLSALHDPDGVPPAARRPVAVLGDVLASPLGVWLVRTAYARADPAELLEPDRFRDAEELFEHLLDALVPAVIETRRPPESRRTRLRRRRDEPRNRHLPRVRHDPDDVRRWLGYLATLAPDKPDLAWWHLARTTGAVSPGFCFAFGLLTTVLATATAAYIGTSVLLFPFGRVLVGSLIFGLVTGFWAVLAPMAWPDDEPGYRKSLRNGLSGLGRTVTETQIIQLKAVFSATIILSVLGVRPLYGLFLMGCLIVVTAGAAHGFLKWVEVPAPADQPVFPPDHLRNDRNLNMLRMTVIGCAYAVIGMATGCLRSPAVGLYIATCAGLGAAFSTGLIAGCHRAWFAYRITATRLACQGHLPRHLMDFLDDAHRLGLLRAVGPVHQFRHQALRQRLAAVHARTTETAGPEPTCE